MAVVYRTSDIKIKGLRAIAGASKELQGAYGMYYLEVFYNKATHEAWYKEHWDYGHQSFTSYRDNDIVRIGNFDSPVTMKELEQTILYTLDKYRRV